MKGLCAGSSLFALVAMVALPLSAQQPLGPTPLPAAAAFQVVPYGHNSAIMVDVRTGQAWKLERDPKNEPGFVWVPVRKLSTNMEIDEWRAKMKEFRAEQRKRRMEEFGHGGVFGRAPIPVPELRIDPGSFAPDPTDDRDPFDETP